MILYYYKECPNCKNAERNLVRECALQKSRNIDERYILALPDIWGEEVERIGEKIPFLYNTDDSKTLHVDASKEGMRSEIEAFIETAEAM